MSGASSSFMHTHNRLAMSTLKPFRGFRPPTQFAREVAAKPYDVLSSDEARAEAAGNPVSFLHVGKPEIDLPPGTDLYDERVYQTGRENLKKLIESGYLKEDPAPYFYLYAQTMGKHTQFGIVGCAAVAEYLDNTIKRHELTRKDKEDDRTRHVEVTNAHTGPIFLTYRNEPAIDTIVDHVRVTAAAADFTASDGIRHQLWVINDPKMIAEITLAFGKIPALYVADGHHRAAAAARVGRDHAQKNRMHRGDEEYNFFLAVLFPHNQLRIMDYNRVVKDLNGRTKSEFLEAIGKIAAVAPVSGQFRPSAKGEVGMYLDHQWYRCVIPKKFLDIADPVERLDVAILQREILAPVLGIDDPRTNKRIDFVGGIRGLGELDRRVDSGEMAVAFALYPTSIEELMAIADAGKIMPPKSTWFEPKLRDGMVVHFLS
jgi:uncharacterized protein (DUF1015 family)